MHTTDLRTYTLAKSAGTPGVLLAMSAQTLGNKHKPANWATLTESGFIPGVYTADISLYTLAKSHDHQTTIPEWNSFLYCRISWVIEIVFKWMILFIKLVTGELEFYRNI